MRLKLVIFDCDGVLVDSEPVANRVTAAAVTELGWPMTPEESDRTFLGMNIDDMAVFIANRLGRKLPPNWVQDIVAQMIEALATTAEPIPGAIEALEGVTALGLPWRVASNSSHGEMDVKFRRIGIAHLTAGRVHSFTDVPRGKPAPDLFLAAAAAEGVDPASCIVVEDSVTGAKAAAAAGMACLGYAPHGNQAGLRSAGAVLFDDMRAVPRLVAGA
jgi:HAD superfamily hydrolase (TIGR01509 family)